MKYLFLLLMLTACGKQVNKREHYVPPVDVVEWTGRLTFANYGSNFSTPKIFDERLELKFEEVVGYTFTPEDAQDIRVYKNNTYLCTYFFMGWGYRSDCYYTVVVMSKDIIQLRGIVLNQSLTIDIGFRR